MNDEPSPLSGRLAGWLNQATRGLPANIAQVVRGELENHYLDAVEAHRLEGLPPEEAARVALAELGDAAEVDAELRTTHISRTRLITAMLACLLYPLGLVLMNVTAAGLGEYFALMIQDCVSMLVLTYVLVTFIRLLGFGTARLARPALVIIAGIVLNVFDRLLFYAIFHQLPLIGPDGAVSWNMASPLAVIMDWIFLGSEVLTGAAVTVLGLRLLRMPERLFGLQRPIALVMLLNAPISLGVVITLLMANMMLAGLVSVIGYSLIVILMALMILTFFRAAFRSTDAPLKAA